jgi:hypothetical protein
MDRSAAPDQGFLPLYGNTLAFQQGNAVGEEGDVRGGAADIQGNGVLPAVSQAENTHDAGRRTGKDGLDGVFDGLLDADGATVGFQDIDGSRDTLFPIELENGLDKSSVKAGDGGIQIGRGDAAAEIEMPGEAMT